MQLALGEARAAAKRGEVPVGAIITNSHNQIIAAAGNRCIELDDPLAHAEFLASRIATAARRQSYLNDCTLWVTLEPCPFCAALLSLLRIKRIVFGAYDPKGGAVEHGARLYDQPTCLWRPETIGGICESECGSLLSEFFQSKRG